jgi:hypothetical protein
VRRGQPENNHDRRGEHEYHGGGGDGVHQLHWLFNEAPATAQWETPVFATTYAQAGLEVRRSAERMGIF